MGARRFHRVKSPPFSLPYVVGIHSVQHNTQGRQNFGENCDTYFKHSQEEGNYESMNIWRDRLGLIGGSVGGSCASESNRL